MRCHGNDHRNHCPGRHRLESYFLYPMLLGIAAFGGICVAAQTKSMLAGTDLSFGPYVWAKLTNFLLTGLLAFLFVEII
ncbi:hypothetical protein LC724_04160 [Blautia sp. RD014234]|nr:hypothetical protein [Blautia parvula]